MGVNVGLTGVTISGADDRTDPLALLALSEKFPFVEWGILRSKKREGEARYPTEKWIFGLGAECLTMGQKIKVSHHLCGAYARAVCAGDASVIRSITLGRRVQINGYLETPKEWPHGKSPLQLLIHEFPRLEFILQAGAPQTLGVAALMATYSPNISALYDPSCGKGLVTDWPEEKLGFGCRSDLMKLSLGYAGGIGPENVVDALEDLQGRNRDFWIDMESGIRTDDRLDLVKVNRVLALAAPFIQPEPR